MGPSKRTDASGIPLSTSRKVLFSIVGFVILPLTLLVMVELVLRMAGVGYSTKFFRKFRIGNEQFFVENDKFGLRFFPPEMARSPSPLKMKVEKEPGTYRIFLLGESAVLGDPRPAYGVGRYLHVLLQTRYPRKKFEVIPAATTAINSHAVRSIARECAQYDGDLWIVYMGNNEMVGPFGATTALGSQSPPLMYVRLSLAIQDTRIGQLLMAAARKLARRDKRDASWGSTQMWMENRIPPEDHRKEVVYENFRKNLVDILKAGEQAHARIILNTVAVNLKDCAPFDSLPGTYVTAATKTNWDQLLADAGKQHSSSQWVAAAALYREAEKVVPHYAELFFQLGSCELQLTNFAGAKAHYTAARDYDVLPFRTDSRLNGIVRRVASEQSQGGSLALFDAESLFSTNSATGSPGDNFFYEHVHFNRAGNYMLARAWAELAASYLPASTTNGSTETWASAEACERQLALTDWNRFGVLEDVLSRLGQAPFTNQLNHAAQVQAILAMMSEIRQHMTRESAETARTIYLDAIQAAPTDFRLHENFAEFLEVQGALAEAEARWEKVAELIPQHPVAYFQAGRLALRLGKLPEAEKRLKEALQLDPKNQRAADYAAEARPATKK
jgi:tetratricopeptide (TPR) repeat protein